MSIAVRGFRRPYSIAINEEGTVFCLVRSPTVKLVSISKCGNDVLFRDINRLGLQGAMSLCITDRNDILILDHVAGAVARFDFNFNPLGRVKLQGQQYGVMKLCEVTNKIFVSILDIHRVVQIDLQRNIESSILFDYSDFKSSLDVDGFILKTDGGILAIDKKRDALFSLRINEGKLLKVELLLSYGRDGFGKLRSPTDIKYIGDHIIIHDMNNYVIQVFDRDLNFVRQVGGKGAGQGQFDLPISGCVFGASLYICDQNNDRIAQVDVDDLNFSVVVCDKFVGGSLCRPSGVAAHADKIYIADRSNGVIQVFDEKLRFLNLARPNTTFLDRPSSIIITSRRNKKFVFVIERKEGFDCALSLYRLSDDSISLEFINTVVGDFALNDPQDMDIGPNSDIYVADTLNRRLIRIDLDGREVNSVNMAEVSDNPRILIKTVSVRSDGEVFTADFDSCVVYHFNERLDLKAVIDFSRFKSDIKVLRGILALSDRIILCVRGAHQVMVGNYSGDIISSVNCDSGANLDWMHPVKVARSQNDIFYVADKENDRVLSFNAEFALVGMSTNLEENINAEEYC